MSWIKKLIKFSQVENPAVAQSIDLLFEESRETDTAFQIHNVVKRLSPDQQEVDEAYLKTIDGFADTAFVALSGMRKMMRSQGVPENNIEEKINGVMEAVCDANNRKFRGNRVRKNEHGKIMKPEGWVGPDEDLRKVLGL